MKDKISYGASEKTVILDDNGSTQSTLVNLYDGGKVSKPIRHRYKIKVKVHSQKDEHEAYVRFSDDLKQDPTMLEPSFEIEHTKLGKANGYYFVVKCYTKLEY